MTRLIVVRHGETDYNVDGVLHGHIDAELNEKGIEQAEELADRLADQEDVAHVYSSDLKRASRTAEVIAGENGTEYTETEKLRGRDFGEYEGEAREKRREVLDDGDELDTWRPEGGENLADMKRRVLEVVEQIENGYPDGTVVIVSHTWANRAIITGLLESGSGHAHQLSQGNTCVNVLDKTDFRGWKLRKMNDTCHLA